jgi:putative sterol carrier protein
MSPTLPDEPAAWGAAWREQVNDSEAFTEAAADFAATVLFTVEADDTYEGTPIRLLASIADGDYTAVRAVDGGQTAESIDYDYALHGPYQAWKTLLTDDVAIEPMVLDGPFSVEGNTIALLKHRDVFVEMVAAARRLDTTFTY